MENKKIMRFAILVLQITIATFCFVSGTFASYVSTAIGNAELPVARWEIELNGQNLTVENPDVTIDLFGASGVYDLKDVTDFTLDGVIDDDVVKSGNKVAPGTWGKVNFELQNKSEVKASYNLVINSLQTTLPLKFSVDGENWFASSDIVTEITNNEKYTLATGTIDANNEEAITIASLYWKWEFDATGNNDNELGNEGTATCTVTSGITLEQVVE